MNNIYDTFDKGINFTIEISLCFYIWTAVRIDKELVQIHWYYLIALSLSCAFWIYAYMLIWAICCVTNGSTVKSNTFIHVDRRNVILKRCVHLKQYLLKISLRPITELVFNFIITKKFLVVLEIIVIIIIFCRYYLSFCMSWFIVVRYTIAIYLN